MANKVEVIFDYNARNVDELSISIGEELIIEDVNTDFEDGMIFGRNAKGVRGKFPKRNVKPLKYNDAYSSRYSDEELYKGFNSEDFFEKKSLDKVSKALSVCSLDFRSSAFLSQDINLDPFDGTENSVPIAGWISLFEYSTEDWTDKQKIMKLYSLLKDKARTWFSSAIARNLKNITWKECKMQIIERFNYNTDPPIISAIDRKYDFMNEELEVYYKDKMDFLHLTNLDDIDKCALLTHGLPDLYKKRLKSIKFVDPRKWKKEVEILEVQVPKHTINTKYDKPTNSSSNSLTNKNSNSYSFPTSLPHFPIPPPPPPPS